MGIKIKAVGKNVILDNELVIKVKEGLDMSAYETGYHDSINQVESVTGDTTSEIHYFFNANMTETDATPFDSAIDPTIKSIQFPNQVTTINGSILLMYNVPNLTEVKFGRKTQNIEGLFGSINEDGTGPWTQTINVLLPYATTDLLLSRDYPNVIYWVPASVLEDLQTAYPEVTLRNISEYQEQA